ncbi:hypothetical protein ES703_70396 [subsurface metagenome]
MAFTDNLLKSILQKAFEIQKWAILAEHYDKTTLPVCYGDTLTYRLSVEKELNLYDILDQLRYDGQGDYAKELEKNRDELLEGVKSFDRNIDRNNKHHLPNFDLCDTAHGLFKKLRRIVEEQTDDNKKLLLYAECIEDLIKDDTKLYPQILRGEFEELLDIIVSNIQRYDLFGELLGRIKEKDPTAATQIKEKYDQLIILSNVENAHEKELKAVESVALNLVSLMREIAETKQNNKPAGTGQKEIVEVKPGVCGITINIKELARRFWMWFCSRSKD